MVFCRWCVRLTWHIHWHVHVNKTKRKSKCLSWISSSFLLFWSLFVCLCTICMCVFPIQSNDCNGGPAELCTWTLVCVLMISKVASIVIPLGVVIILMLKGPIWRSPIDRRSLWWKQLFITWFIWPSSQRFSVTYQF